MDLVFCGTPAFAVPTLEKLVDAGFRVRLVVTQPDRAKGRGMELAASPVKLSALERRLPVLQPAKIKHNEEFRALLGIIHPDAIIVVGYGRIIPQWMIDLPRLGNLNLHASLLPKYRGAAPIQWAIANGETVTGVTTMQIDAGLDTGDILLQAKEPIRAEDTAVTLSPRLAHRGAELMISTLAGLANGTVGPQPQDHANATLAPILKKGRRPDGTDLVRPLVEYLGPVDHSASIGPVVGKNCRSLEEVPSVDLRRPAPRARSGAPAARRCPPEPPNRPLLPASGIGLGPGRASRRAPHRVDRN